MKKLTIGPPRVPLIHAIMLVKRFLDPNVFLIVSSVSLCFNFLSSILVLFECLVELIDFGWIELTFSRSYSFLSVNFDAWIIQDKMSVFLAQVIRQSAHFS